MKIEWIDRGPEGKRVVPFADRDYVFQPEESGGPWVCEVADEAHYRRFLQVPGFRQDPAEADDAARIEAQYHDELSDLKTFKDDVTALVSGSTEADAKAEDIMVKLRGLCGFEEPAAAPGQGLVDYSTGARTSNDETAVPAPKSNEMDGMGNQSGSVDPFVTRDPAINTGIENKPEGMGTTEAAVAVDEPKPVGDPVAETDGGAADDQDGKEHLAPTAEDGEQAEAERAEEDANPSDLSTKKKATAAYVAKFGKDPKSYWTREEIVAQMDKDA